MYKNIRVYQNFFQPVLRIEEKVQVPLGDGKYKVKWVYGPASTPLERLEKSGAVAPQWLEALKRFRDETNPLRLREEIYDLIEQLFALPGAVPGVTEDVFQTLNLPSGLPQELVTPVTLSFDK